MNWLLKFSFICGCSFLMFLSISLLKVTTVDIRDSSDTSNLNSDVFFGGEVLGLHADKVRRVAEKRKIGIDADTLQFFMRVPISKSDFLNHVGARDFDVTSKKYLYYQKNPHSPEWFPKQNTSNFIGSVSDENSWRIDVFKLSNEHLAFHIY